MSTKPGQLHFTYDPAYGRMVSRVDGSGTTTFAYNAVMATPALGAGEVASVDGPFASDTITYGYDELGRIVSRTLNGVTTIWAFDALKRLTALSDPIGSFTYSYVGTTKRLSTVTYPNGQITTYAYLPNVADKHLQEIHHQASAAGATLLKLTYAYDGVGNISLWTQQYGGSPANAYDLNYDAADQVVSAIYRTTDPTPVILKRYGYDYDPAGNRTSEQIDDAPMLSAYDTRNRLTSVQPGGALLFKGNLSEPATVSVAGKPGAVSADSKFQGTAQVGAGTNDVAVVATDPSGNVRTNTYQVTASGSSQGFTYDQNGSLTAEGTKTYEWDGANRLWRVLDGAVEVARFVYDGQGRRTQKTAAGVTRTYVYDGADVLEERLSTGTTIRYIQGLALDQHLASVDAGVPTYYLTDHLGSVLQATDPSGTVTLTRQYDPWGKPLQSSSVPGYGFTGRDWDAETGLYYYRARYYNPPVGRFISEDPAKWSASANFYSYVRGNPITSVDPFGLQQVTVWCIDCCDKRCDKVEQTAQYFCNRKNGGTCRAALAKYNLDQCADGWCNSNIPVKCVGDWGGCGGGPPGVFSGGSATGMVMLQPRAFDPKYEEQCGPLSGTFAHEVAHLCGIGADPRGSKNADITRDVDYACRE